MNNPNTTKSDFLLEKEFEPHYSDWKLNPTPINTGKLLSALNPVMQTALTTYAGPLATSPTIKSRAKIITLNALPTYNPSKAKLKTYLMSQLQGLRRYTAREDKILSIPEQVMLDAHHLYETETRLSDQLGRPPTDTELADVLNLSKKRLQYIRSARPQYTQSMITRSTDDGEVMDDPAVVAPTGAAKLPPYLSLVHDDLDPVDQLIMEYSFGMNKPVLSNLEIAKKLNLSPGAISHRKARIQAKIDEANDLNIFG